MVRHYMVSAFLVLLCSCSDMLTPNKGADSNSENGPQSNAVWADDLPLSDAVVSEIYAPSNMFSDADGQGPWPRDVLWLFFHQGTTPQQKQEVVDTLVGTVVAAAAEIAPGGGIYVRMPTDGTSGRLDAALTRARQFPQVLLATYDVSHAVDVTYLRPDDGANWRKADWSVTPAKLGGANWALEAVNAPLAWGCEQGSRTVPIAVIDKGFYQPSDLQGNFVVTGREQFGHWPANDAHATWVSSVLGAVGNNQQGMTGMMWRASILPYEGFVPTQGLPFHPFIHMVDAVSRGARVVNISLGLRQWTVKPSYSNTSHVQRATEMRDLLQNVINQADTQARLTNKPVPLYVIGAGNDFSQNGLDAFWSGFPQVMESADIADHAVVVGSSNQVWAYSTDAMKNIERSYVQVAAPGENVPILTTGNVVTTGTGTSFAAPLVSGLAGLLLSFDSTLTAQQVKTLILLGAQRGGHNAGGVPVIDAYESLKAAAETPGRVRADGTFHFNKLCGNEVWTANSRLYARHGNVATHLFNVGSTTTAVTDLSVAHGGDQIQYNIISEAGDTLSRARKLAKGQWVSTTKYDIQNPPTGYDPGGTGLSALFVSHDRTFAGQVQTSLTAVPGKEHVFVSWNGPTPMIGVRDFFVGPAGRQGGCASYKEPIGCDREYDHPPLEGVWTAVGAISPQQRFMLVAINRRVAVSHNLVGTIESQEDGGTRYTFPEVYEWHSDGSYIYRIDLDTYAVTHVGTIGGVTIYWLGISEDDNRVIFGMGEETRTEMYGGTREPMEWSGATRTLTSCAVHFRLTDFRTRFFDVKNTNYACPNPPAKQNGGNGTVSPRRRVQ